MQFREVVRFTNPQRRYPPATKRHPITGSKEAIRRTSRLPRWRSHHDRHRIITALVIGLVIGALARLILPGKQNIPIWLTILVGLVGALLGTLLAQYIGVAVTAGVDWIEIVLQVAIATVGVAIVSGLYNARRVKRKL